MSERADGSFPATHWTLIARLRNPDETVARTALDELCAQYHYPLYCYIRHRGLAHHDAQDALQDFFAKLLRLETFAAADAQKGRLRTYLATALQRFLINWRRDHFEPVRAPEVLDANGERYRQEQFTDDETPERVFERQWGHELLARVLRRLREEYAGKGRSAVFETLRPILLAGATLRGEDTPRLAATLGLNPVALRKAFSRLLGDYRDILEGEVFLTVASRSEVEDEIDYLFRVFGKD